MISWISNTTILIKTIFSKLLSLALMSSSQKYWSKHLNSIKSNHIKRERRMNVLKRLFWSRLFHSMFKRLYHQIQSNWKMRIAMIEMIEMIEMIDVVWKRQGWGDIAWCWWWAIQFHQNSSIKSTMRKVLRTRTRTRIRIRIRIWMRTRRRPWDLPQYLIHSNQPDWSNDWLKNLHKFCTFLTTSKKSRFQEHWLNIEGFSKTNLKIDKVIKIENDCQSFVAALFCSVQFISFKFIPLHG
jgi:hypothetical protein